MACRLDEELNLNKSQLRTMRNTEEEKALQEAITKLQEIREQGFDILDLLEFGPSGEKVKDGQIAEAARKVSKKRRCKIGHERARKAVELAKAYTPKQWMRALKQMQRQRFAPEFGTLIRLFPLGPRERNKLLKKVIEEKWTKADLDAELELRKPDNGGVDENRRGRLPKAAKSLRGLKGQAAVDARRYAHILDVLEKGKGGYKLTRSKKDDLKALSELLRKVSKWED